MIDTTSPTWRQIVEWAEKKIEDAQRRIEVKGLDYPTTEALRYEIAAMRELIKLPLPKVPFDARALQRDGYGLQQA